MKVKLLKKLRKLAKEKRKFGRKGDNYVVYTTYGEHLNPLIWWRGEDREEGLVKLFYYRRDFILDELAKYRYDKIKFIDI